MSARPEGANEYVIRAGRGEVVTDITPERAGWGYSGLEVRVLDGGARHVWHLTGDEGGLLPLRGALSAHVTTADGEEVELELAGREAVWDGPVDFAYLPLGSRVEVQAGERGARVALARARASSSLPVQVLRAADVPTLLRGAGACSRQVHNYTIGSSIQVERLLVCEVYTPGGNTSGYPPHKHDTHSDVERELEEIYYFEVADTAGGPGMAYHRNYGTPDRPIDVLAEVRSGDVALVPHGYHGPSMTLPGVDLYYLNVMAGPATDGEWLMVDDPAWAWLRASWEGQPVDPRLPFGRSDR
ncbi:5-deoxy-glucuronate isomerase [Pseudactinotalea suaedae]|uniref:5-deoxy-glucuronate isomerase n=1 Tax=Pseudactinotalea suaedae TaxID=1524924 RepID=UPI001F4F3F2F|nr:5-deoxy-glucuronate isomerase [Pseudactinotalea suaedae]